MIFLHASTGVNRPDLQFDRVFGPVQLVFVVWKVKNHDKKEKNTKIRKI